MSEARRADGSELEVRLLGPLELLSRKSAVPIGGPKQRMLLAALALERRRVVSVDRLVESLWPGEPPETAGHAIQVYVSQLRKALGAETISTRAPGYALELDPGSVDVHRFAELVSDGREKLGCGDPAGASSVLREGLALWRGPALADFTYEPFAQTEIARLEELRVVALEERIEADLALGRHTELVSELEALVDSQPLRERPRGQLMLALYRAGRQADALAAYRAARETLVEELGIEPGPDLRGLEAAILRQDEALLPTEGPAAPAMQFRRLVTILFVDIVESMALAGALDAEALGRVLSGYFETVSAVLTRHGGTVEKFAGDAVMAVFGIPVSHEDDALRAARAALDIRAAVRAFNERLVEEHDVGLEIRIGLETGEVVTTPTETRQRLVTGEAVGIASRLEQAARADEIVIGELAGRLIDHAARLEPLGELEIKGKREPVGAFRLLDLEAVAPAFERRLDAALVGRKRELAALRRSLKRAVDGSRVQVAMVVGAPGVGKSRLAAELARRAKGVTTLFGRCLSYGEGITYWPLREVVRQAVESEERDAILAALEADTPPPAPEIAWRFRKFCEARARERPFVVVFDDLHWAEPTFLELVEHLADKGAGPILVVGVARDELLDERPTFLEGRDNAEWIVLDALTADETDALLDGLGGAVLESDQRRRIVETADGNPLFLEQLLALALEGGLGERPLPETIQSLLAARLDRLGPGERAVLERGAVIGKEFAADDVLSLLDPAAVPTAGAHLRMLSDRGFVRPRGDDAFSFRHVLVQEAIYRGAPKRLRAELHERFADRLNKVASALAELDELVGYHLEQAHSLRSELGESDRRTDRLAEDGGRRLGDAGMRAFKRGDMPAATNLLGRATALLSPDDPAGRDLLCDLAIAANATRQSERAIELLADAIDRARTAGDPRVGARAHVELEYIRVQREHKTVDDLLAATATGIPIFQHVGDHRALGRAWLISGWASGGHRGDHAAWADAVERALDEYRAAGWPTAGCVGELAAALYWGPVPVEQAMRRCRQLLDDEVSDRPGTAYVLAFLGGLEAQRRELDRGRRLVDEARAMLEDLGLRTAVDTYCIPVLVDIELYAEHPATAESLLRELCERLEREEDFSHLASRASDLAEALTMQGLTEEASEWTRVAERHAAPDDLNAQISWRRTRARAQAHPSTFERAEQLAREALSLAETTDDVNCRAKSWRDLGVLLLCAGRGGDAAHALERAADLFEQKGNLVAVAQLRLLQDDRALV
jgi:DNA-binding SARP family transcriptional activator/tetratricopeptide (TPR) repeat protein